VEAKLPSLPKFKASWPIKAPKPSFDTAIAGDIDDYYSDDEAGSFSILSTIDGDVAKIAAVSTCITAACAWVGKKYLSSAVVRHRRVAAPAAPIDDNDEGPLDESLFKTIVSGDDNKVTASIPEPPKSHALPTPMSPPVHVKPTATKKEQLTGIEKMVGSSLLRATANGTRLELVATHVALGTATAKSPSTSASSSAPSASNNATSTNSNNATNTTAASAAAAAAAPSSSSSVVVGLYLSSAKLEREMKSRQLTRQLLSSHVESVRAACKKEGDQPLELVYVSLDEDERDYREMVRGKGGGLVACFHVAEVLFRSSVRVAW
jgi:hypothetical protein